MSLEQALDDERKEIMDILEGRPRNPHSPIQFGHQTASPAPPIRSMLDMGKPTSASRHGSIAGTGLNVTPPPKSSTARPRAPAVRSMLDPQSPPPNRSTHSATTSPTVTNPPPNQVIRRSSDATKHPPRRAVDKQVDVEENYRFEMLPSISSQALPKRVTQGGKKHGSMVAAVTGDLERLPGFTGGRDSGRHNSTVGIGGKSKSPSLRLGARSQSPGNKLFNSNSFNPMPTPGTFVTDRGKVIDMKSAYRRLSDAALIRSGGSLSTISARQSPSRERLMSEGESMSPTGGIRLEKDYFQNPQDEGDAIESSDDEEEDDSSSGDNEQSFEASRGRRRSRRKKGVCSEGGEFEDSDQENVRKGPAGIGKALGPQKVRSLLGAAEEECPQTLSTYKVKSLLDPVVTVTGPKDEKMATKKKGVHPHTSFDHTTSRMNTPFASSDEEADLSDIKRAQQMSVNLSPIDSSVPNRVIRTILRGEFAQMQLEAEDGRRRQRMYLVATDLSDEAVYALEWTIGTILRDGDTLFAVYAVDEEVGTGKTSDVDPAHVVQIGEGAKAIQDAAAVVGSLTEKSAKTPSSGLLPSALNPFSYIPATSTDSHGGSVDSRGMSRAEQERFHAIDDISQTCVRLLRKTRLQVRVAVEVVHCKSPKHMITEAIDSLEPTLVILGSRGRSALKGVLLGSFSNYLVTKSSVPVMVARKKLKKHAKYKNANIRLSNNLTNPTSTKLASAKID